MRMLLRFLGMTGVLAVVAAGGYLAVSPEGMPKTFDGFMGTVEGKVFLISAAVVAAWLVDRITLVAVLVLRQSHGDEHRFDSFKSSRRPWPSSASTSFRFRIGGSST